MLIDNHLRRGPLWPAALLLCALLLGGGGPHAPVMLAIVEAVGFFVLLQTTLFAGGITIRPGMLMGIGIILAMLLLFVVQMIPLPLQWVCDLAGRDLYCSTLALTGIPGSIATLSLSPDETRRAALTLLAPIAMFVATMGLGRADRRWLVRIAIAVGIIGALAGAVQIMAGDGRFFPYGLPPYDRAPGLFANYNHQALFLSVIFVLVVADWIEDARASFAAIRIGLLILLTIGIIVTSSRAGIGLLTVAVLLGLGLWTRHVRKAHGARFLTRKRMIGIAAAVLVGCLVVGLLVMNSYRSELMADRIVQASSDTRFSFWTNTRYAIGLYFPVGSGFGTFDTVYQSIEPLGELHSYYVNHAHNDYLEIVLEGGVAALLLMAAFGIWLILRLTDAWRRVVGHGATTMLAAGGGIFLILLHSILDYPLRTMAGATLFALCCALLIPPPSTVSGDRQAVKK